MTPTEAATVYARLAYVIKILQEGREPLLESSGVKEARDACLFRALNELQKAMTMQATKRTPPVDLA